MECTTHWWSTQKQIEENSPFLLSCRAQNLANNDASGDVELNRHVFEVQRFKLAIFQKFMLDYLAVAVSAGTLVFIVIGRSCSKGSGFDSHY